MKRKSCLRLSRDHLAFKHLNLWRSNEKLTKNANLNAKFRWSGGNNSILWLPPVYMSAYSFQSHTHTHNMYEHEHVNVRRIAFHICTQLFTNQLEINFGYTNDDDICFTRKLSKPNYGGVNHSSCRCKYYLNCILCVVMTWTPYLTMCKYRSVVMGLCNTFVVECCLYKVLDIYEKYFALLSLTIIHYFKMKQHYTVQSILLYIHSTMRKKKTTRPVDLCLYYYIKFHETKKNALSKISMWTVNT